MTSAVATAPVILGRDIRKTFRRETGEIVQALDGVSLEVGPGRLTALVGPDGAGKTTLIRLVAGLMTAEGLKAVHRALEGLGYVPPFKASKQLRDVETSVRIEFLVSGQYPGDGKPKPVSFPDPKDVAVVVDGVRYIGLTTLVELKLASGMTNAARLKDLADVQELIKVLKLPREFGEKLNSYVRGKFEELHQAVESDPSGE